MRACKARAAATAGLAAATAGTQPRRPARTEAAGTQPRRPARTVAAAHHATVEPSLRIMERLGMRREAEYRDAWIVKGEWVDEVHCAILEDGWRARQVGS